MRTRGGGRGRGAGLRRGAAGIALLIAAGCAQLDPALVEGLLGAAGLGGGLDERTVSAGLREALRVGTERTVSATGREDGYLGNPLIRIAVPDRLESTARTLRSLGLGPIVDDFERSMNRAAERAAQEATPVFARAIGRMTFADALAILDGGERAATDYFERATSRELSERFGPIVRSSMEQVGVVRLYDGFVQRVAQIPGLSAPSLDLDAYVTQGALRGLFRVLADEEARIRRDPAARTTELLRRVFGASGR